MKLATDLIAAFSDRIAQVHLSGFAVLHDPLFITRQMEIIKYCRQLKAPIVIESLMPRVEDLKNEYDYIVENLKK